MVFFKLGAKIAEVPEEGYKLFLETGELIDKSNHVHDYIYENCSDEYDSNKLSSWL